MNADVDVRCRARAKHLNESCRKFDYGSEVDMTFPSDNLTTRQPRATHEVARSRYGMRLLLVPDNLIGAGATSAGSQAGAQVAGEWLASDGGAPGARAAEHRVWM